MQTRARRVALLLFDEVELFDVAAPLELLSSAGRRWNFRPYRVELLAQTPGLITTRNQARLEATQALAQAEPAELLIIPGGYGARRFAEDSASLAELARLAKTAELLAAVGNGVLVLARAGLLAGERVAAASELLGELAAAGVSALDTPALVEGERVLSVARSGAALELGFALIRRTLGDKLVAQVASELGLEAPGSSARVEIRY